MEESVPSHLRSLNNDTVTYVKFLNRTERKVHLFWLDYKGSLVRYGDIPPDRGVSMNTYVTHPWIARDAISRYPLMLNGQQVFYPQTERNGNIFDMRNRDKVEIHIPVFPLFQRCLEVVYLRFKRDAISWTNIPANIKEILLKMSPQTEFKDYMYFHSIQYELCHNEDIFDDDVEDEGDHNDNDGSDGEIDNEDNEGGQNGNDQE